MERMNFTRTEANWESFLDQAKISSPKVVNRSLKEPASYHDDPAAVEEWKNCDYSIHITKEMAKSVNCPRKVRIYTEGTYDLFHLGHVKQLMQAKNAFPNAYLIVGIQNDQLTSECKGKTVQTEEERYETVRHCRYVDEVVKNAPWYTEEEFFKEHKIDFIAHDDLPYHMGNRSNEQDVFLYSKSRGKFISTQRTEGISTSDLIARIVADYDLYLRRNISRGISGNKMNVSYLDVKKIQFQTKMDEFKSKIKQKKDGLFQQWQNSSRVFIHSFLELFGKESHLNNFFTGRKETLSLTFPPCEDNDFPTVKEGSDFIRDSN